MTLEIRKAPFWNQSFTPILSKGWVSEPPDGTKLGRLQVMASVPEGETFEYRTLTFTGSMNYFKHVYHNADPIYDFEAGSDRVTARNIPESEIPLEVLEAFDAEVDTGHRWR